MIKKTISFKLNIILIVVVFIVLAISGTVSYFEYSKKVEKDLSSQMEHTNKRLALILPSLIWTFQVDITQGIIETEALNDAIDIIVIKDVDGTIIASVIKDEEKNHYDNPCRRNIDIIFQGEHIATAFVYHNHDVIEKAKDYVIRSLIIKTITILLLLQFLVSFFINKYIISNIIKLQENIILYAKDKNSSQTSNVNTNDEIGFLSKEFEKMKISLKSSWDELNDLNLTLEHKIEVEVEKNKEIQAQLYKSEKLAAMGEVVANIAHQWRQPLAVISTISTGLMVQQEYKVLNDKMLYDSCNDINENITYLSNTIDDFTNFLKDDRYKEIFILNDALKRFLSLVDGPIKKDSIKVKTSFDENITIDGYSNELLQCLINIFNNAKDALVETNNRDERYIFIDTYLKNKKVYIEFKDNANGIPMDVIDKVFEPYFTTKHQSRGTGLGLNITYKLIVEGMSGNIIVKNETYEYDNKTYKGAKFIITLPLY